jgi:hypothetical protein
MADGSTCKRKEPHMDLSTPMKKESYACSYQCANKIAIATINISTNCKSIHGGSIRQCANLTRVGRDVNIYDDWNLGHICTCDLEVLFDVVDTNVTCGAFGFLILSYNY